MAFQRANVGKRCFTAQQSNEVGNKVKLLLIKLLAVHGKENINVFFATHHHLKVENFPKSTKEGKDLLAYEITEGYYKMFC
eukprot:10673075-Ditylum_brightwellii.AAC.1